MHHDIKEFELPVAYDSGNKISLLIQLTNFSIEGEPFWSWIPKNHIQVRKVKENFVISCLRPP